MVSVAVVVAVVSPSCTDDATTATTMPIPGVPQRSPVVAAPQDPFCEAIVGLDGRADTAPADPAEILATFDRVAELAPASVAADFDVVRAGLRATITGDGPEGPPELSGDTDFAEATERFSIWVDETCRGTDRSPLPPPTQPGMAEDTSD